MKKTLQSGKYSKERIFFLQLKKLRCIVEGEDEASVKWELALSNGQIESDLQGKFFSGYGVDTGNGCSMDDHALKLKNT